MKIKVKCPGCKRNITVIAKPMDGFANVCELHICRLCYEKFRVVLDLLVCVGCSGHGALNNCGPTKIYIDLDGRVINDQQKTDH